MKHKNKQQTVVSNFERHLMTEDMREEIVTEVLYERSEIDRYRDTWNELSSLSDEPVVSCEEYFTIASNSNNTLPCIAVLKNRGKAILICPFLLLKSHKKITISKRRAFRFRARKLQLAGRSFIGNINSVYIRKIFEQLKEQRNFDLVATGELELDGSFYKNLKAALSNSGWRLVRAEHKVSIHWLIDLNPTFDEYLAGFSGKTRSTLRRKIRKFDTGLDGSFRVISEVSDIDEFLEAGEKISRLTYQWDIGQRFNDDEATRQSLTSLAQKGHLRGYLLYAHGQPCAFMRGSLKDGIYDYATPGFDPELKKFSPGTVLLLKALEDLITNTNCRIFDFGTGGDLAGYKKMFGNRSYEANSFEIGRFWRPYTFLLLSIHDVFSGLKHFVNLILGDKLKRNIKNKLKNI